MRTCGRNTSCDGPRLAYNAGPAEPFGNITGIIPWQSPAGPVPARPELRVYLLVRDLQPQFAAYTLLICEVTPALFAAIMAAQREMRTVLRAIQGRDHG